MTDKPGIELWVFLKGHVFWKWVLMYVQKVSTKVTPAQSDTGNTSIKVTGSLTTKNELEYNAPWVLRIGTI